MPTIKQLRESKGWAQIDLALRLGVDQGTVSKWERGISTPRIAQLREMVELFNVPLIDIELPEITSPPSKRTTN